MMPEFIVTNPEGQKFRVNAPEGATQEEALAYAQNQFQPQEKPPVTEQPTFREANFIEAMGRGMMDVYQGGAQLAINTADLMNRKQDSLAADAMMKVIGMNPFASGLKAAGKLLPEGFAEKYNKKIEAELNQYNKLNPDFQWGRLTGGLATPLTFIPGAKAATVTGKVATGAATGSIFSLFQPVQDSEDFFKEKGKQAAIGATIGASLPIAGKIFSITKSWMDEITKPLYKKGIYRDIAKFLRENITENRDKITKAIQKSIDTKDGKTVGQIIADANRDKADDFGGLLVRLEKDLAKDSDILKSGFKAQQKTRSDIIGRIAGTEDDFARATSVRTANAEQNYARAFEVPVRADQELANISKNRYVQEAIRTAQDLAEANGINPKERFTEFLHYVKIGLDKQVGRTGDTALAKTEQRAVERIKDKLTGWLGKKNPLYEEARKQFQVDSAPINRMEVGRELQNALSTALEKESPSTFTNALRNAPRMIKRASGFSRFQKLDDVLPKQDVSDVKKVASQLAGEARRKTMATDSMAIISKLPSEIRFELPHILSRPVVITNHILQRMGVNKSREYKDMLVDMVRAPAKFERMFNLPEANPKAKMATDIIRRLETAGIAQTLARGEQNGN